MKKLSVADVLALLNDEQISNLKKLARYLATKPKQYVHFDMTTFFGNEDRTLAKYEYDLLETPRCGSVACAVGHGPAAGIFSKDPELMREILGNEGALSGALSWQEYYTECLIPSDGHEHSQMWHWCFSSEWADYDNTPYGAAQRIFYMLKYGVPETFDCNSDYPIETAMVDLYQIINPEIE